ncbi:helix-turn-helix domain-containing protein [Actinomadura sp. CNU-125]|uniref:helix-turn-helix domain-containing protein n=1 Tax=Actinomadura sp. CNU-125 TaxID=1904961 RepID=UPI00096AB345|nr:helix-turn-helix domain-containing protein [Actinomadura sp. CNU-125]
MDARDTRRRRGRVQRAGRGGDLRVHHSTLQERLVQAERLTGWPLDDAPGRFRLHLALVLRRLHRAPPL